MKLVPISNGQHAMVDDIDYERVTKFNWSICHGYANAGVKRPDGTWGTVLMHRLILDAPKGTHVDHIDWNGLNNQRYNIRVGTPSQNIGHSKKRKDGKTSRFRGVNFMKAKGKFRAEITVNRVSKHLGLFTDEVDAATAYNFAAQEAFGEFANYNAPA